MLQALIGMMGQTIVSITFLALASLLLVFSLTQPAASPARKARLRAAIIFGAVGILVSLLRALAK